MKTLITFALFFCIWSGLSANEAAREYFKFAKFSYDAGEYSKALDFIDKAIDLAPDYSSGLILRSEINLKLERYDQILKDATRILQIPNQSNTLYGHVYALRGAAYYFTGDNDRASLDLNRSIFFHNEEAMAYFFWD